MKLTEKQKDWYVDMPIGCILFVGMVIYLFYNF